MSKAADRVADVGLDALWDRSEPDLEIVDGQIRPARSEPSQLRNRALGVLGVAAPAAAGAMAIALGEIARWD